MDIPNLSNQPITTVTTPPKVTKFKISPKLSIIIVVLGLLTGFGLSSIRSSSTSLPDTSGQPADNNVISIESVTSQQDLVVGKIYGNSEKTFKDIAIGTIEKGSINGEGTHILNREGGTSQRASLTSSAVDLDLFIGKKVEIKGETNASTKTSWLLDVGNIKILE